MTAKNTQLAPAQEATQPLGISEKFTQGVIAHIMQLDHSVKFSEAQNKLLKKYFIVIDGVLKTAELKRQKTSEQYRDALEISWGNVNMNKLSQDVADLSSIGIDCSLKNSVFFIPFKNNALGKYDLTPMFGYAGMETKARNFAIEYPKDIVFKLVYSNDNFQEIIKDKDNPVNTVIHKVTDSFNRGDIVGGYWWKIFEDESKNEVKVLTLRDIEKRKPKNASVEFWGGEKAIWKGGQKTAKTEEVDGWFEEMCIKTIKRHCFDSFVLSSEKMNEYATRFLLLEEQANAITYSENEGENLAQEVAQNANKKVMDFDDAEIVGSQQLNEAQPNNMPAQPAQAEPVAPLFNEMGNAPTNTNEAEHPNF
jgi:recombination protein RecT